MPVEDEQRLEVSHHRQEQAALAKEEAHLFISKAITDLGSSGGFDSEPRQLMRLLDELESTGKKRSVEQIRADAVAIIARRNLDH